MEDCIMVKVLSGYFLMTQLYCRKAVFKNGVFFSFFVEAQASCLSCVWYIFLLFYLKKKKQALVMLFSSTYEFVCDISVTE